MRSVPPQRLLLETASPGSYRIRVQPTIGAPIDTPVAADGRVTFEVPVKSRDSAFFVLWIPVYHYPPPESLRVIQVMREQRSVRKLSAQDIGRLPTDADGYHRLKLFTPDGRYGTD